MKRATRADRSLVINLLSAAFDENKSVNYIIPQDNFRQKRIRVLMDYSFETCFLSGDIYLSDDEKACALISFPDRKKNSFRSILADVKLIFKGTGFGNISKVLRREKAISSHYPNSPICYLWFIGVLPEHQNQGIGRRLLNEIMEDAENLGRPIYLETSTEKNLPWYHKAGFTIYHQMDFGYTLNLLKREFF
ncbi:GNAT family N-acetyltransferase [Dyadobacter sp. LHD-138]|uniref:GNAT family N-acetyltransferase n=1 Tax=Dyadobacter sp. LHD-138 TaxID=3071413 RepID=UPI0027E1CE9E|nr:GNAT family N-acetyltransferase [Dyadobacter sp. LHD-138]MDQ6479159.1 GNAT family N-acetyltransferase [Dyadobacter sp. LHD-138]